MIPIPTEVEQYIWREVLRQHDPGGYTGMTLAWQHAMSNRHRLPMEHDTMVLAYHIKDHEQANVIRGENNYRTIQVQRKDDPTQNIGADWRNVPRAMESLFVHGMPSRQYVTPYEEQVEEFTYELLSIHPFGDGNGRTASLIRNWLLGTLETPSDLPFYFNES